jgi:hypothetical protein
LIFEQSIVFLRKLGVPLNSEKQGDTAMSESPEMGMEIGMEISMEVIGKVAGTLCVELLKQSKELEYRDSEGNLLDTSLDGLALNAHRLAWICCTGQVPEG